MSVEQEILVTGIKVVDLLAPYVKGGKIGNYKIIMNKKKNCLVNTQIFIYIYIYVLYL